MLDHPRFDHFEADQQLYDEGGSDILQFYRCPLCSSFLFVIDLRGEKTILAFDNFSRIDTTKASESGLYIIADQ